MNEDDGSVLWSFLEGEQNEYEVTVNFLTNLDDYEVEAVVMEALNTGNGKVPKEVRNGGISTSLELITTTGSNVIKVRFPSTLSDSWTQGPLPDRSVYGFFDLKIREPVTASFRKVFKPMSGLVEISFSPTHEVN